MLPIYKIVENIAKDKLTHIILSKVDPISEEIIEEKIKLKIGKELKDQNNNFFIVNGYYGDYLILRSHRLRTHPIGKFLMDK